VGAGGSHLASQEAEIRRIMFRSQPRQIVCETYLEKPFIKIGLVEWVKVKALSSSPSTTKKMASLIEVCK
jgi:hypothetical protein